MATCKVTFTLDQATITRLEEAALRLTRPKSQVVREAILEYYERIGRLSERERLSLLGAFDSLIPRIPARDASEADREIRAVRRARRLGGRRSS
jgi:hypothetical protein